MGLVCSRVIWYTLLDGVTLAPSSSQAGLQLFMLAMQTKKKRLTKTIFFSFYYNLQNYNNSLTSLYMSTLSVASPSATRWHHGWAESKQTSREHGSSAIYTMVSTSINGYQYHG